LKYIPDTDAISVAVVSEIEAVTPAAVFWWRCAIDENHGVR